MEPSSEKKIIALVLSHENQQRNNKILNKSKTRRSNFVSNLRYVTSIINKKKIFIFINR